MRRVKFKVVKVDYEGNRWSVYAKGKYCIMYSKNTIVRAIKGTLGVAVFETRYQAEMFMREFFFSASNKKVIRVVPVGRGNNVAELSQFITSDSLDCFYERKNVDTTKPPSGTMFYPAVEVIE